METCTGSTESNVNKEIEQVRNTITNLEESISSLAERLTPVTLPRERMEKEKQAVQPDRSRCQLDSEIHSLIERIQLQVVRITTITSGLQI